jgi:tetratricopeptide (TPR) repeat protein
MTRFGLLLFPLLFGVALADDYELFTRYLELGEFQKAEALITKLAKPSSTDDRFLRAQIAFHNHEYAKAKEILGKMDAKGFEKLAQNTADLTAGFKTIESEHFILRYAPGKDEILPLYASEVLEKAYSAIGYDLGVALSAKVLVEFYPSWKNFMEASTLTETEVRTSGTIALCKFNRLLLTTPRAMLLGYDWMDTLAHEFAHYLINRASNVLAPVWLHEGIAKYEEVRWRKTEGSEIAPRSAALLRRRLKNDSLIPFEKLHPSIAKLPSQEDAELAFAQVFFFVKYLIEENGGSKNLKALLNTLGTGIDLPQAFTKVYGKTFAAMFPDWKTWLKKQNLPSEKVTAKKLHFQEDASAATAKSSPQELHEIRSEKARGWIRLGDLLSEKKRYGAALKEFEKARGALDESSPFLLNKISLAAFALGNKDQALESLSKAIEQDPTYVTSYVRRGMIELGDKNWMAAERDFLKANAINPFDPALHAGLVKIYEERANPKALERERQALKILEQSPR